MIPNMSFGATACELLKNASIAYCNNELDEAIESLSEFVIEYPNHQLCEDALGTIADLHFENKQYLQAKTLYNVVLINNGNTYPDKWIPLRCFGNLDKMFPDRKFGCDRLPITYSYENNKNHAALMLSKIYLIEENYEKSVELLIEADHKYYYSTHCGTDAAYKDNELALLNHEVYQKLNLPKVAIKYLLKQSFEMSNDTIIQLLKQNLPKLYSKTELKNKFKTSVEQIRKIPADSSIRGIDMHRMTFLGCEIDVESYYVSRIGFQEYFYNSRLYNNVIK